MLDAAGGTDVVAVRPHQVTFIRGTEHLACMSLSERGTLRWYTSCCKTPVGNTPRDFRQSHVGLVHTCLGAGSEELDGVFGPVVMRVNSQGAKGKIQSNSPALFLWAVLQYLASMSWSRLSGKYKRNPFFQMPQGIPLVQPYNLSSTERAKLLSAI